MAIQAPTSRGQIGGVLHSRWDVTVANPVNAAARTSVFDVRAFEDKHFKFSNTSDQIIVITIESVDDVVGTDPRTVGSAFNVAATTGTDEVHITDGHMYLQVKYDPAADATGNLVIKLVAKKRAV